MTENMQLQGDCAPADSSLPSSNPVAAAALPEGFVRLGLALDRKSVV